MQEMLAPSRNLCVPNSCIIDAPRMTRHVYDVIPRSKRRRNLIGAVTILRIREDNDSIRRIAFQILLDPVETLTGEDAAPTERTLRLEDLLQQTKSAIVR